MLHPQSQIVTAASMDDDIESKIINLNLDFGFAVQADYATSGTLGGSLALQASTDHIQDTLGNVLRAGNFVTITSSIVNISGAGSYLWNVPQANYSYFKLIYTPAISDTGTLNAYCTQKGM